MNPIYRRVAIVLVLLMIVALLGGFFAAIGRGAPAQAPCSDSLDEVEQVFVDVKGPASAGC